MLRADGTLRGRGHNAAVDTATVAIVRPNGTKPTSHVSVVISSMPAADASTPAATTMKEALVSVCRVRSCAVVRWTSSSTLSRPMRAARLAACRRPLHIRLTRLKYGRPATRRCPRHPLSGAEGRAATRSSVPSRQMGAHAGVGGERTLSSVSVGDIEWSPGGSAICSIECTSSGSSQSRTLNSLLGT